jgi:hypothetical protein
MKFPQSAQRVEVGQIPAYGLSRNAQLIDTDLPSLMHKPDNFSVTI